MTTLKNELIGTWRLLSYIEVPINGVDSKFPMGKNPKGLLMQNAEGYMSMQISSSERSQFSSADRYQASADELISHVQGFIAFAGPYKINESKAVIQYALSTSSYPNWEGKIQERRVDFDGDVLYLKSVEPILSNGEYVNSYMTWHRIEEEEFLSRRERFLEYTSRSVQEEIRTRDMEDFQE
ncbi:MAG TPA: lipocalin-like domain-containing protein [Candidatus Sphingobacterium stercorigallinarum]|nr:lipocalin-like domain-containing protein [Candidatus Sphingobacterium stercorigallinarum]